MTSKSRVRRIVLLLPWLLLLVMIPFNPQEAIAAATRGVSIWWEVLFPALFPFFVIAEMLLGFGLVHFIGCLFDPMMRPIFRVPGYGGFVLAMGFASGYPIGARLTSQLWQEKLMNREEGERLVAFTSTSDPIFLIGAVSVGFFHDAGLAVVLAAAHYGGSLIVGFCMRWHGGREQAAQRVARTYRRGGSNLLRRALMEMHRARLADPRSLGDLLKDAIQSGLKLVFMVGALVVFISVILELLSQANVLAALYASMAGALQLLGMPEVLSQALIDGLFEVTLGAKAAGAAVPEAALMHSAAMAAFILSWAGLSVHAQIMSLLTQTNLRYAPFVAARLLHGLTAAVLVYALWRPLSGIRETASGALPAGAFHEWTALPSLYGWSGILLVGALALLLLLQAGYVLFSVLISIMMRRTKA